jgi:antibiotic biosynthesis monooxygenase (ABM) superfamily enzyme
MIVDAESRGPVSVEHAGPEVTLVSAVLLREGAVARHRALHDDAVAVARRDWGLTRAELIAAVPGVQDDMVALLTFRTRAHLDRWLVSHERREVLRQMARLTRGDRRTNVLSGFPGWFTSGPSAPARWKQAVVVVIGLIPVSLVMTLLRDRLLPDLPIAIAVIATSVANVSLLTWVVMPRLNRLLRTWLVQ